MTDLWKEVQTCNACEIAGTTTCRVFGDGNVSARIALIGEGPGEEENLSGRPFIGNAGKLLTEMLRHAGLSRDDLFIANAVKCWANRDGNNRSPTQKEIDNCSGFLNRQLEIVSPAVIVAMGNAAVATLTGTKLNKTHITDLVGFTERQESRWLIYTFHPSYLLHRGINPALVDRVVEHFRKAKEIANDRENVPRPDGTGVGDGAANSQDSPRSRRRYRRV